MTNHEKFLLARALAEAFINSRKSYEAQEAINTVVTSLSKDLGWNVHELFGSAVSLLIPHINDKGRLASIELKGVTYA